MLGFRFGLLVNFRNVSNVEKHSIFFKKGIG